MNSSYDFDMSYLRIISEIKKHFPEYQLIWDEEQSIWAIRISKYVLIGLMSKKDMLKDADISDPDTYNHCLMQMIGLIDQYGRTND
jgi:hypothetical protein